MTSPDNIHIPSRLDAAEDRLRESQQLVARYGTYHFAKMYRYTPRDDRRWNRKYASYYKDFLPTNRSARILDLGCGGGRFLCFLRSQGYSELTGVDADEKQLEALHKAIACRVARADVLDFLREDASRYDLICCHHLIEHFSYGGSEELLRRSYQALLPGGRLLVTTPNGGRPWAGFHMFGDLSHDHLYTSSSLKEVMEIAGFDDIDVRPEGPVPGETIETLRWVLWKFWREPYLKLTFLIDNGKGCLSGARLVVSSGIIAAGTKRS
ncbi:MAG: class I SAM-dependent methyltransferase [Acidobacteria bacterium]|nr:class I SAM-dependent methyltransferase [Acidobacteriota bacterium]